MKTENERSGGVLKKKKSQQILYKAKNLSV